MGKIGAGYDDIYTAADARDVIVPHVGYFMHVNTCISAVGLNY